jgi:DNA-binding NtrC family response regulator
VWSDDGVDFKALVNDFETQLILQALEVTKGNKKEAARILNLKRTTLLEKIKKKNLQYQ